MGRVGLGPDRPAFCGCNFCFVTNWQCDLGYVPSLSKPQPPSRHRPPPSPRATRCYGWRLQRGLLGTRHSLLLQCALHAKASFLHASAQERSHSESNGPVEQVHPSCCNDYWINTEKRAQAQVHCPKVGKEYFKMAKMFTNSMKGN